MSKEISLVVLSHGLWGVKKHMLYIEKKLEEKYGDSIYIVSRNLDMSLKANRYIVEYKCE